MTADGSNGATVGRVANVQGPLVEVRFPTDSDALNAILPFDALTIQDAMTGQEGPTLTVIHNRSDGIVRCVNVTPETAVRMADVAAVSGVWRRDLSNDALAAVMQAMRGYRTPSDRVLETGIKAIDFLCPLCPGGMVGLFGGPGVGAAVLIGELRHRLGNGLDALNLILTTRRADVDATRQMRHMDADSLGIFDDAGRVQTTYLLTENATDPVYCESEAVPVFDAALYLSPLSAVRGHYPPVDPLWSRSRLLNPTWVGHDHGETYHRYYDASARVKTLMYDPSFVELMAFRANRRAAARFAEWEQTRLAQLAPEDARLVGRVRRVEKFLTQPYYTAEPYTGMPGKTVPRDVTVRAVRAILDGAYDHVPERGLFFIGDISEARTA
jgi:F0F1-type ATP synthase beta subunit